MASLSYAEERSRYQLHVASKHDDNRLFIMQTPLCILLIIGTVVWFGIAMMETSSTQEESKMHTAEALQLAMSPQEASDTQKTSYEDHPDRTDPEIQYEEVSVATAPPLVHATAFDTLVVKLPVSDRPRSNDETRSLIKIYHELHREFLVGEQCLSYFAEKVSEHSNGNKWVGQSILGGPTFLRRELGKRVIPRQRMESNPPSHGLILEAHAESRAAATELANYLTKEYLVLISKEETHGNHPRLLENTAELERLQQRALDLETQFKTFKLKNKALFQAEPKDKVEALLDACRQKLARQDKLLQAIGKIFVNRHGNFDGMAALASFQEFKNIQLKEKALRALKQELAKNQGRADIQKKVHAWKTTLENEITLMQGHLKTGRTKLLEEESFLRKQVLKSRQSSDELSLRFPKLQELQDAKNDSVSLGKKIALLSLQWAQACKHLKVRGLRDNQIQF